MSGVPPYQSVYGKPICTRHKIIHDGQCVKCAAELLWKCRGRLDAPHCDGRIVGPDSDLAMAIDEFLGLKVEDESS